MKNKKKTNKIVGVVGIGTEDCFEAVRKDERQKTLALVRQKIEALQERNYLDEKSLLWKFWKERYSDQEAYWEFTRTCDGEITVEFLNWFLKSLIKHSDN